MNGTVALSSSSDTAAVTWDTPTFNSLAIRSTIEFMDKEIRWKAQDWPETNERIGQNYAWCPGLGPAPGVEHLQHVEAHRLLEFDRVAPLRRRDRTLPPLLAN